MLFNLRNSNSLAIVINVKQHLNSVGILKMMTNEDKGRAYEFLIRSGDRSPYMTTTIRRAFEFDESAKMELEKHEHTKIVNNMCMFLDAAVDLLSYDSIGKALSENIDRTHGKESVLKKLLSKREEKIQEGIYRERPEPPRTYEEQKKSLCDDLAKQAVELCKKHGIKGAEITVESVPSDGRDQFIRQNGSRQLMLMERCRNKTKVVEAFGVVIRNAKDQVINNLFGREITISGPL